MQFQQSRAISDTSRHAKASVALIAFVRAAPLARSWRRERLPVLGSWSEFRLRCDASRNAARLPNNWGAWRSVNRILANAGQKRLQRRARSGLGRQPRKQRLAVAGRGRSSSGTLAPMLQTKPYESFADASRRAFEYHVNAAPVALPIISLCLAGLIWWNPPSAWFVLLNIAGGIGVAVSWACQMRGQTRRSWVAALASLLLVLCGVALDIHRDFILQFGQGLGLISLPFYIFALTQRRKLPAE